MTAKATKLIKRNWIVDYRLDGTVTIEAASREEAQAIFDAKFAGGLPRFVAEAEVSNSLPEPALP